MTGKIYDNIIIGGSYAAIGFLLNSEGENLLLCPSVYIEEFSPCFRFCRQAVPFGGQPAGMINPSEMALHFYKKIMGYEVLFETLVSDVDNNSVKVHNCGGQYTFSSKNIILAAGIHEIDKKHYTALITNHNVEETTENILPTCYPDIFVLRLEVPTDCSYTLARQYIHEHVHEKGFKLILTAPQFETEYKECVGQLSGNYQTPLEAFERGCCYASSLS